MEKEGEIAHDGGMLGGRGRRRERESRHFCPLLLPLYFRQCSRKRGGGRTTEQSSSPGVEREEEKGGGGVRRCCFTCLPLIWGGKKAWGKNLEVSCSNPKKQERKKVKAINSFRIYHLLSLDSLSGKEGGRKEETCGYHRAGLRAARTRREEGKYGLHLLLQPLCT